MLTPAPLERRETALYRHYDASEALLYIGITFSVTRRWGQHCDDKGWIREVVRTTYEWFPDRPAALEAERSAIIAERPRYNVQHARSVPIQTRKTTVTVGSDGSYQLKIGSVVALGLANGECPVGIVEEIGNDEIVLSPWNWIHEIFTDDYRAISTSDVAKVHTCKTLDMDGLRAWARLDGMLDMYEGPNATEVWPTVHDMDDAADFQREWKATARSTPPPDCLTDAPRT